ncbi:MAG: dipeptidyl aminopeptidase/acylaminoacyl peptidase [Pseudohongiellaceae bacterium]|jgi:dipeptidyl aminopeptidase/acylaminoacyl peptidase
MRHFFSVSLTLLTCLTIISCTPATTPIEPPTVESSMNQLTGSDYERAEKLLRQNTDKLLVGRIMARYWQDDDRLVYRRTTANGSDYVLIDAAAASRSDLVDSVRLAALLAPFSDEELDENDLTLAAIKLTDGNSSFDFRFEGKSFALSLPDYGLLELEQSPANEYLSPDGSQAAFIENHNLMVRDTASNSITALTFDGIEDYGYATNNAGWIRDAGPVLKWSPDSTKIATFRHDARLVKEMAVYNTQVGHVDIDVWKYPLPGDETIFMIERVVIHLDKQPKLVVLDMPIDAHRSTTSDHIAGFGGEFLDVQWSLDSETLAFVSSSRDHKVATLRIADPLSGGVRDVFTEASPTYFESGLSDANWRVLHDTDEFIWFSEKDNWGHLYLHDLNTGELKTQITAGSWRVLDVLDVDEAAGTILFTASMPDASDPYYHYLYRVNLDGSGLVKLTEEEAHHSLSMSNSHNFVLDYYSTPTDPGTSVLRNNSGEVLMTLEQLDLTLLLESGWVPPEPVIVKARDQLTDIYGLVYKPSNFDAAKSYPVLNYLYPGPQSGSVGTRSFVSARGDKQAIAELGFIVVEVDAMGTPGRTKSFHDAYYGNMGDNGLPDQMAAIRQLAADRPYMDLERVGIWGHSGGGFASTAGILRYPEFYKVAVSGAGNHDNRNYEDDWGEKWQGLLETYPEGSGEDAAAGSVSTNYDNQANQLLADQLQGKLLLAHGMMDTNVHPSNTLLVVDALIKAEKDFDLVLFPNAGHGFGNSRYFMKKRWDYFVRHLAGLEPVEYKFADNIR